MIYYADLAANSVVYAAANKARVPSLETLE